MDCVWVSGVAEAMRPLRVRVQEGDGRSGARGGSMLALARSGNELPAAADQSRAGPCPKELHRCRTGMAQPETRTTIPCADARVRPGRVGSNGVSLYQPFRCSMKCSESLCAAGQMGDVSDRAHG